MSLDDTPEFARVADGYDPAQVDAYIARLRAARRPVTDGEGPARKILVRPTHPAAQAQARRQSAERGMTADESTVRALREYLAKGHEHAFVDEVEDDLVRLTSGRRKH